MTAIEMQRLFETKLYSISPVFNDTEKIDTDTIFRYINTYQSDLVRTLYQEGNTDLLKKIVVDSSNITPTENTSVSNSVYYTFSDISTPNFLYYLRSRSKYNRTLPKEVTSIKYVYNEEIKKEDLDQFITSAFNKPFFRIPKSFISNNTLNIISDAYTTITGVIVTYIRKPIEIGNNDCELDESLHTLIVDGALNLFISHKTMLKSSPQPKDT